MNETENSNTDTNPNVVSNEAMAISELSNQVNQYVAVLGPRMIAIEAQQFVIQDLLKTLLVRQGVSKDQLDQDCLVAFKEYENRIAQAYGEKLENIKNRIAEISNFIPGK